MSQNIAPSVRRDKIKELIESSCIKNHGWVDIPINEQLTIIRRIERSCMNSTVDYCTNSGTPPAWNNKLFLNKYSSEIYRIVANLDPTSSCTSANGNSSLFDLIMSNNIDLNNITHVSSEEMNPEISREIRETIAKRKEQVLVKKISKQHTCSRCKKKETEVLRYQGRSADEDSNFSIRCIHCLHTWRR